MKNLKLNKEEILLIALFSAIWAAIEILLGNYLHLLKIPFRGTLLTFFAAIILNIANNFIRKRGALLLMAIVTSSLKALSAGGFVITPIIAILMEAIIAEFVFFFLKSNLLTSMIAGVGIMLYTLAHSLIAQIFIFGIDIIGIYNFLAKELSGIIGVNIANIYYILSFIIVLYIIAGIIAGFLSDRISQKTLLKLQILSKNE